MSKGECSRRLRLNSGAAFDPKQKMLSVVRMQQDTPAKFSGRPLRRWLGAGVVFGAWDQKESPATRAGLI